MSINFSGLASGIDTNELIGQLMALERLPIRNLQQQKAQVELKQAAWNTVKSRLQDLQSKADALRKPDALAAFKAASTNDKVIQASAGKDAAPGVYAVEVTSLATAQSWASGTFATTTDALGLSGPLNVRIGDGDVTELTVDATDSLTDIRDKLRGALGGEAGVSIVMTEPGQYALTVNSTETGTAGAVRINASVTDGSGGRLGLHKTAEAADAQLTINGLAVTRSSNVIDDAVAGLTLTLGELGTAKVTVSHDTAAQTARLKQFVDSYNALMTDLHNRLRVEAPSEVGGERAKTDPLYGESALRQLQTDLRQLMTSVTEIDGEWLGPADLGISGVAWGGEGFMQGHLKLDADKLAAALAENPDRVEGILGGADGVATKLYKKVEAYTQFGGVIDSKATAYKDQLKNIADRTQLLETMLTKREEGLRRQFTAFETVMAKTQTQMTWLGQQLAMLPGMSQR